MARAPPGSPQSLDPMSPLPPMTMIFMIVLPLPSEFDDCFRVRKCPLPS